MSDNKSQSNEEKKVPSTGETSSANRVLNEKYDELLRSANISDVEKNKWKATFQELGDFYNNAPCGYYTQDDTGLILKMNQTQLALLGYTEDEMVGKKNIMELLSEDSSVLFYKYMPVLRDTGRVDQVEVEFVRKDGKPLFVLASARAVFDEQKNFKHVVVATWDITDRKKMENEMLKVNKNLRSASERFEDKSSLVQKLNEELLMIKKDRDELISSLSTDFDKPLEKALALCRKLLNSPAVADAEANKNLRKVEDSINQLCSLVNNYKVHERVTSDKASLQVSKFNFSKMLVTIINRLDEQAEKRKINIHAEIYEELWLKTDKQYMAQVIDTLLSTAIKLSLPGREIPLRLIRKVDECIVEIEVSGLDLKQKEFADLIVKKNELLPAGTNKDTDMVMNSHLISVLVEMLGCELTVGPVESKGTLIRLSMAIKR
jgi:PAS domain S-box-containing protein